MSAPCPVVVRGKVFPSIRALAKARRVSEKTCYKHLRVYGHLDFLGQPPPWTRPDRRRAVTIGPLTFESVTAAAEALGVDRKTIRNMTSRPAARQTVMISAMRYSARQGDDE